MDSQGEGYASQEMVFDSIGSKILENAFKGLSTPACKIISNCKNDNKYFLRLQRMYFCLWTDRVWEILHHDGI